MRALLIALTLGTLAPLSAQTPVELPKPAREIPLYAGPAPGSEKWDWDEATFKTHFGNVVTRNVVRPVLQYFPADRAKANGSAVIVTPGGGFTDLMIMYSGITIAQELNAAGVDAFILKYRLVYTDPKIPLPRPGVKNPTPPQRIAEDGKILLGPQKDQNIYELDLADARTGIRWIRSHAGELGLKPNQVGMIGFSAGAVLTHLMAFDAAETRPDFVGLIYGASKDTRPIPADAPPAFIAVAADDPWAVTLSLPLFSAWRKAERPAELHVFQMGAHGFVNRGGGGDHFMDRFIEWMSVNGWLKK